MRWQPSGGADQVSRITRADTDALVKESEELRDQLTRLSARADAFADQLQEEVSRYIEDAEGGNDHEGTRDPGTGTGTGDTGG